MHIPRRILLVLLVCVPLSLRAQESLPSSRPHAGGLPTSPSQVECNRLLDTLASPLASPFGVAGDEAWVKRFASELASSGCVGFDRKSVVPTSFAQPISFTIAGFDPKSTFVAVPEKEVRIEIGSGFNVIGVDYLVVSGLGAAMSGEASEPPPRPVRLDPNDPSLKFVKKIIEGAGGKLDMNSAPPDPSGKVFITHPMNWKTAPTMPHYASVLRGRGAKAVIVIDDAIAVVGASTEIVRSDRYRRPQVTSVPGLYLSRAAAAEIGRAAELPTVVGGGSLVQFDGHQRITVSVKYESKTRRAPNMVGVIPGSDPREAVLLSCDLESTAFAPALLAGVASALSRLPDRPARSIVLLGACRNISDSAGHDWFLAHLPAPIRRVTACIHVAPQAAGRGPGPSLCSSGASSAPLRAIVDRCVPGERFASDSFSANDLPAALSLRSIPTCGVRLPTDNLAGAITAISSALRDFAALDPRPAPDSRR